MILLPSGTELNIEFACYCQLGSFLTSSSSRSKSSPRREFHNGKYSSVVAKITEFPWGKFSASNCLCSARDYKHSRQTFVDLMKKTTGIRFSLSKEDLLVWYMVTLFEKANFPAHNSTAPRCCRHHLDIFQSATISTRVILTHTIQLRGEKV